MVDSSIAPDPKSAAPGGRFVSDEDRFFEFTKKYVGLLAAVASVPLVTGALGVLEPPVTHKQLSILASAFSVITFGAVFLLRSFIGWLMRTRLRSIIPVLLTFAGLFLMLKCAAHYIEITEAFEQTAKVIPATISNQKEPALQFEPWQIREQCLWYLGIYPLFAIALGFLTVSAFTQQKANTIQSIVTEGLMDKADELEHRLGNLRRFYELSEAKEQETFKKLGHDLVVSENGRYLNLLANGIIDMRGEQALKLQMTLQRCFTKRFDAVSKTDLNFWCLSKRDTFANEYLKINADAVKNHTSVNRIFLLEDRELLRWRLIQDTLDEQSALGIGWGVAPMEALDPLVKGDEVHDLDFALFNFTRAVSFFREPDTRFRRLQVIFDVEREENRRRIWEQANRFLELVTQCWFVNAKFAEELDTLSRFIPEVRRERARRGWTPRADAERADRMCPQDWLKYIIAKASHLEAGKYAQRLATDQQQRLEAVVRKFDAASKDQPVDVEWKDCFLLGISNSQADTRRLVCETLQWRSKATDWKEELRVPFSVFLADVRSEKDAILLTSTVSGFEPVQHQPCLHFSIILTDLVESRETRFDDTNVHCILAVNGTCAKIEHRIPRNGLKPGSYSATIQARDAATEFRDACSKTFHIPPVV